MDLDDIVIPQVTDIIAQEGSSEYITALDKQLVRLFQLKTDLGSEISRLFQDGVRAALGVMRDTPGVICVGVASVDILDKKSGVTYSVDDYPILHFDSNQAKRRLDAQLGWIHNPRRVQAQRLHRKVQEIDSSGEVHVGKIQSFTTVERKQGSSRDRRAIIYYKGGDDEIYVGSIDLLCGFTRFPVITDLTSETLEEKINEPVPKNTSVFVVENPSRALQPQLYLTYQHLLGLEKEYFGRNLIKKGFSRALRAVHYDPDVRTLRTLNYGFVHGVITGFDFPGTLIGNRLSHNGTPNFYLGSLADRRMLSGLTPNEYASWRYQVVKGLGDAIGIIGYLYNVVAVSPFVQLIPLSLGFYHTRKLHRQLSALQDTGRIRRSSL